MEEPERVKQLKGVDDHHSHNVEYEWQTYPLKSSSRFCSSCDTCDMNRNLHKKIMYYIAVFEFKALNVLYLTHYIKMKYFKIFTT
jgi:uncharacterized membrane protein